MKILITGAHWMLGRAFVATLSEKHEIFATTRENFDITDVAMMMDFLRDKNIDVIINAAAFTDVRAAEMMGEGFDNENFRVNAFGVEKLVKIANENNIFLVHFSTDYVFDGEKVGEYLPSDLTNPKNFYGKAKEKGESYVLENCKKFCIIRTSWLYNTNKDGNHFVWKIFKKLQNNEKCAVINDNFGRPTSTWDLTEATWKMLQNLEKFSWKILHFTSSGEWASWYDIAYEIAKFTQKEYLVEIVSYKNFEDIVSRPENSCLYNDSEIRLSDWKVSLQKTLKKF